MPMPTIFCRKKAPAKSSPVEVSKMESDPVRMAASHTLRPTPPLLCRIVPGVEVCSNEFGLRQAVAVMSKAAPPMTRIFKENQSGERVV